MFRFCVWIIHCPLSIVNYPLSIIDCQWIVLACDISARRLADFLVQMHNIRPTGVRM